MRKYEKPELEVVKFWDVDVIITSPLFVDPEDPDSNEDNGNGTNAPSGTWP